MSGSFFCRKVGGSHRHHVSHSTHYFSFSKKVETVAGLGVGQGVLAHFIQISIEKYYKHNRGKGHYPQNTTKPLPIDRLTPTPTQGKTRTLWQQTLTAISSSNNPVNSLETQSLRSLTMNGSRAPSSSLTKSSRQEEALGGLTHRPAYTRRRISVPMSSGSEATDTPPQQTTSSPLPPQV